jgi:hypothetical protein
MAQVYTHYDNLKVARNAPREVIRAAYRVLSQKFHPDRNPDNADAERIMAIINTSYEILSDPNKRQEHDQWIALQERERKQTSHINSQPEVTPRPAPVEKSSIVVGKVASMLHILRNWLLYGFAGFMLWIWVADNVITPQPGAKPYQANPAPVQPEYLRPSAAPNDQPWPVSNPHSSAAPNDQPWPVSNPHSSAAPNGQPWPVSAGYVKGYQRLHMAGLSTVTVDNSQNDSDVFAKLVSLNSAQAYPVRQFYIPAFGSFTLNKVTAGSYDIRYRDIKNGGLSRSEAFSLTETETYGGTQFSHITMTLYKVQNGNMQTYGLSEAEF